MEKPKTRHGRRAAGKTQTSISLRADLLASAKAEAEKDGRSFSNWLERLLEEKLKEVEKAPEAGQ